jgi:poly(A) polymerase
LRFAAAPPGLADAVRRAREAEPAEPLLRGDELGVLPGPEVGRLLELVAEERAAGTIATREEALDLVRREAGLE